jgi:carbon starvation protein
LSLPLLALLVLGCLGLGYRIYGRRVATVLAPDDTRPTPAVLHEDGVDFVPTRPFYLLGQHFSAIAAAGPIAGPILACQMFGWLPCILWIGLGVVFIGAVHDFSSLVASVRHRARSVAEIARDHLGPRAWLVFMLFIWIALVYVIVAFADITASTFVGRSDELPGGGRFDAGGAVAGASILYLTLSVLMGVVQRRWDPPLWILTLIFVPATLGAVWAGTVLSTHFVLDVAHPVRAWGLLILAYCFVASLVPIWSLLQPRGYLGGFVLYMALFVGIVGLLFGGFPVQQEAFKSWVAPGAGGAGVPLVPFLFVTIACGACSGFHGLVCSGTTSKQIARESHCRPVGYGAMLLEAFVALIALATIMILAPSEVSGSPGRIYGNGLGRFLGVLIGPQHALFAATFGAMAFSTFVFDTLDVSTRLGRYILQELFRVRGRVAAAAATLVTLTPPLLFLMAAPVAAAGQRPAYMDYWTLFGSSNQLLAALSLLAVTVWLYRSRRPVRYTLGPMLFVLVITLWSLGLQMRASWRRVASEGPGLDPVTVNGVAALLLALLALALVVEALRSVSRARAWQPAGAMGSGSPAEPAEPSSERRRRAPD